MSDVLLNVFFFGRGDIQYVALDDECSQSSSLKRKLGLREFTLTSISFYHLFWLFPFDICLACWISVLPLSFHPWHTRKYEKSFNKRGHSFSAAAVLSEIVLYIIWRPTGRMHINHNHMTASFGRITFNMCPIKKVVFTYPAHLHHLKRECILRKENNNFPTNFNS